MKIVVLNNQTLLDIAIQEYGTIEAVFELAMANGLGITDELTTGTKLKIIKAKEETEILGYYKQNTISLSTGITKQNEENIIIPDGIGFMEIESTFKIG